MASNHYRARAEKAIGRKLLRTEHVHHHSLTQLLICDDKYHAWLHRVMRERGMKGPEHQKTPVVQFRITRSIASRLLHLAEIDGRSVSDVIRRLVDRYIETTDIVKEKRA